MIISKFNKRKREPDRPKIKPEMMPIDWLIEGLAIAALMTFIGYAIYWYQRVPQIIPIHFDASGNIDNYGSKIHLLILPGIGVFIYVLLTAIGLFPHTYNFTQKITPENAPRQYLLATRFIRFLKSVIIGIFFFIGIMITRVSMNQTDTMGIWLLPVILGFVFIPIIVYLVVASRK
jgi:uncharacterized membrane protein